MVSFMSNVFEFGDALQPEHDGGGPPPEMSSNQPYLNLAT
jgi:hypothetical protein